MTSSALPGAALAIVVALAARRTRSLTAGGAVAAALVGAAAMAAGWGWGLLLITYFVASTLLSRVGRARKEQRTASIVEKGGERDAVQVLANGAIFAAAALAAALAAAMLPDARWLALGAGSLAAATADTWATEVGTLGGAARSVLTWRPVPPGTSGGVSLVGSVASLCGAAFIALVALALGWPVRLVPWIIVGGAAGSLIDSLLGATLQARRWCDACASETERITHDCGTPTRPLRGLDWLNNDVVNFLSNAAGGLLAVLLAR